MHGQAAGKKGRAPEWFYVFLSLLTLVTFTCAQSLYEALAQNQKFIALRVTAHWELLEIIFVFNFLPALVLFLAWKAVRRWKRALASEFLAAIYAFLFLLFFFQIHNHAYLERWQEAENSYLLWLVPAGAVGLLHLRYPWIFRSFVLALSPVVVIFPALFLLNTWSGVESQAGPETAQAASSTLPALALSQTPGLVPPNRPRELPPIFLVVFDEFALHAILDETGQIDAGRFPNFRKLAAGSYWFRNATANADSTLLSMPAILTGNFPDPGKVPTAKNYPENLLNLLRDDYDVYVYEWWENFCVKGRFHCVDDPFETITEWSLLHDLYRLFVLRVLPKGADFALPWFIQMWGHFEEPEIVAGKFRDRFDVFSQAVAVLPPSDQGVLFFFHHALPHSPYLLGRDGEVRSAEQTGFITGHRGDGFVLGNLLRQYRMQVMCVDSQLGRFVGQLQTMGLYDKSLLIVTADHGVSYKLEAPGRALYVERGILLNADQILNVPLFIKLPSQMGGMTSDQDVQLIDIVPTVAKQVGLQVPWATAGRNIFQNQPEERVKVAYSFLGKRYELPPVGYGRLEANRYSVQEIEQSNGLDVQNNRNRFLTRSWWNWR